RGEDRRALRRGPGLGSGGGRLLLRAGSSVTTVRRGLGRGRGRGRRCAGGSCRLRVGVLRVALPDQLHDLVVARRVHELVHADVHGGAGALAGAVGELLLGDHHVPFVAEARDRLVGDLDVVVAGRAHLRAQHRRAHGGGAHSGVAGEDDPLDRSGVAGGVGRRGGTGAGGARTGQGAGDGGLLALHLLHLRGGGGDVAVLLLADLEEQGGQGEADRRRGEHCQDDPQVRVAGGDAEDREDRAGGGRGDQAG